MSNQQPDKASNQAEQWLKDLVNRGEQLARSGTAATPPSATVGQRLSDWWCARRADWQFRRSCTRIAELSGFWFRFLTLPLPFVYGIALGPPMQLAALVGRCLGVWLAIVIAAHLLSFILSSLAARYERLWAAALPFPLSGYLDVLKLGVTSSHKRHESTYAATGGLATCPAVAQVRVEVQLERPLGSAKMAQDLLRATVPEATLERASGNSVVFGRSDLGCTHSCYRLRRWMHGVVEKMLFPLHQAQHITEVKVTTSRHPR